MSTWISKFGLAVACLLPLSGCLGEAEADLIGRSSEPASEAATRAAPVPKSLAVAGGDVVIAGPQGYCIDEAASRDRRRGAFVLLAACGAISGDGTGDYPFDLALLTASVGAPNSGEALTAPAAVERYFRSAAGRAALSRNGDAETVRIIDSKTSGTIVYLRSFDTAEGSEKLNGYSWRAIFEHSGRMVSANVLELKETEMTSGSGLILLEQFVSRIRAESGDDTNLATQARLSE